MVGGLAPLKSGPDNVYEKFRKDSLMSLLHPPKVGSPGLSELKGPVFAAVTAQNKQIGLSFLLWRKQYDGLHCV